MKTKQDIKLFIAHVTELNKQVKDLVIETLRKIGKPIEFDWDENCAPTMISGSFNDDQCDNCYITRIWLDGDLVMANLHAFYLGEDRKNIDLSDEYDVDWLDLLDWISDELEDEKTTNETGD